MWLDDIADLRRSELLITSKQRTAELRVRSLLSTLFCLILKLFGSRERLQFPEQCLSTSAANSATASTMMRRHRVRDGSTRSGKSRSTSTKTQRI